MPGNRLELDIVANDQSAPGTQKAAANFKSVEQEAARAAQGMTKSFDAQGVELVRSVEKATAGAAKALQSLEKRAALAGKSGVEKLLTQRSFAISGAGSDEAQIQRIVGSYDKLISAQQRLDRSRSQNQARSAGIAAGQAVLPGAAGFDAALAAIQKKDRAVADIERRARFSGTDAVGRLALEETDAIRQLGKTPADVDRIRASFAKLRADAQPAARSIADSLDDIGTRATRVGGTLAILSIPLAIGAKHAIDLASQLQSARVGFETLGGSAAVANKHIADLQTFAATTPFEFTSLIRQSRFLQASGFKTDEVIPTLRAFGNAVAAGGGGTDELERVLLQVGQIRATGRATLQDLKPIAQAGVPVFDILAKAVRKPGQDQQAALEEVRKGLENGRFGAIPTLNFLTKEFTSNKYAGALEKQSGTLGGQLSNLKDQGDLAFAAIGESAAPSVSKFVAIAQIALLKVRELAAGFGTLPQPVKDLAVSLGAIGIAAPGALFALGGIAQAGGLALNGLSSLRALVATSFGGALAGIIPTVGALSLALAGVAAAAVIVYTEFSKTQSLLKNSEPDFSKFLKGKIEKGDIEETRGLVAKARSGGGTDIPLISAAEYKAFNLQLDDRQKKESGDQFQRDLIARGIILPSKSKNDLLGAGDQSEANAERHRISQEVLDSRKQLAKSQRDLLDIQEREAIKPEAPGALVSQDQFSAASALAIAKVNRDHQERIAEATTRVGKTGKIETVPLSAETRSNLEAKRNIDTQIELAKLTDSQGQKDEAYYRERLDRQIKTDEEAKRLRLKYEQEVADTTERHYATLRDRRFAIEQQGVDSSRELALTSLEGLQAQTLQEKLALEDSKLAIEQQYAARSLEIQLRKLSVERTLALGETQRTLRAAGISADDPRYADAVNATTKDFDQQAQEIKTISAARDIELTKRTEIEKGRLVISQNRAIFDNLKQSASGLFDALISHTQSFGDALKATLKSAILTPIKEILASQTAALLTQLLTGQKVTFGAVGTGQGPLGQLGGILGRAGLGQPKIGGETSKLDLPGHLGDVGLINNAVPVVITNPGGGSSSSSRGFGVPGVGALATIGAAVIPMLALARSGVASAGGSAVTEAIKYEGESGFSSLGKLPVISERPSTFGDFVREAFGGGRSSATGSVSSSAGNPSGTGGILGSLKQSIGAGAKNAQGESISALSNLKGFFGFGGGPGGTYGSGVIGKGFSGGLKALGGSNAALLGGGLLAFDGLRRGGFKGTLETTVGGALIGYKFGGPIGAAIGAGVGLAAGLLRQTLFKGPREKIKKLVKELYGLNINNGIADQISQVAKQAYGGDIGAAVRSQEVRNLLKLYAESTGQKNGFTGDTIHAASLVQSGGALHQGAIYDDGQAYSYKSPLDVAGGISTTNISTRSRELDPFQSPNITVQLDGRSSAAFLQGQTVDAMKTNTGRQAVSDASLSASSQSYNRLQNLAKMQSPSTLIA